MASVMPWIAAASAGTGPLGRTRVSSSTAPAQSITVSSTTSASSPRPVVSVSRISAFVSSHTRACRLIASRTAGSAITADLASQGFQERGVLRLHGLELARQPRGGFAGGGGLLRDRVVRLLRRKQFFGAALRFLGSLLALLLVHLLGGVRLRLRRGELVAQAVGIGRRAFEFAARLVDVGVRTAELGPHLIDIG